MTNWICYCVDKSDEKAVLTKEDVAYVKLRIKDNHDLIPQDIAKCIDGMVNLCVDAQGTIENNKNLLFF